jgi:Family of unknown function (DUF6326)
MVRTRRSLLDAPVPTRLKLSALWMAVMFCYVYGDFFSLFKPGRLVAMQAGQTGVGATTQGMLLAFAILMSIPSVMIFLTLVLRAAISRWANIILGVAYTLIMMATMFGAWAFYIYLAIIEIILTALIVWHAWRWPREANS